MHFAQVDERHAAVGLGVEVDEQRLALAQRERGREIDGGGRLADAAFLIGNSENHRRGGRPSAILRVRRSEGQDEGVKAAAELMRADMSK